MIVDGLERNEDGEWRADENGNSPGIFFPASDIATPGTKLQQENGPPDALDEIKIVGSGSVILEGVTIVEWDERFTTTVAQQTLRTLETRKKRRSQKTGRVDAMAAAVLLQGFLDSIKRSRVC